MIVSVDFDGVLHSGEYPKIGIASADAVNYMRKIAENGHYIIINTCRNGDLLVDAVNFLLNAGIPFNRVNDNCPYNMAKYGSNTRKIYADLYIDDHNVGGLPSWEEIYKYIEKLEKKY